MPTIDELEPATAASDTDEIPVSQSGIARKVTRAQLLDGVQPQLALPPGALLGRTSTGTGAPETITIGANLTISAGTLSAAASPFVIASLPTGTVPTDQDLVPISQSGVAQAIPYGQFMAGISGLSGLDASQMLVTPTGKTTSLTLADSAGAATTALPLAIAALPKSGGTLTGPLTLAGDPAGPLQPTTKRYADTLASQSLKAAANLSDLSSITTARSNLGLGSISTQSSANVAITGGTISNISSLNVPGPISTSSNLGLNGSDIVAGSNGHGIYFTDTAGHTPQIATSGDNVVLWGVNHSGNRLPVWSYLNNTSTTDTPLFCQVPFQVAHISTGNPTYNLSTAGPSRMQSGLDIGTIYTGSYGSTESFSNQIYVLSDTANADNVPINNAALKINYQYGGPGTTGGRTGLRIAINPIGTVGGPNQFQVGAEIFSTANYSFGGTNNSGSARGQLVPINTVGRAYSGATNLVVVSGFGEINMGVDAGASAAILNGFQISRLNSDAGPVSRFRAMMFAGTQTPAGPTNTIPDMDYGIVWGHDHHQWSFGANSRMIGWIPQGTGTNSGGAPIYPSKLGWGVDLWGVNIVNQAWRSTGFQVDGTGAITIGTTRLAPTPSGLAINASGQYVSAATINANGSGYQIGEYLYGPAGDIYTVSALTGTGVGAVTIVATGYANTPPANPVAVSGGSGIGATLNLIWTTANSIAVGGTGQKIGFLGANPTTKSSVTGSRNGNTALASLITALSAYGLLTDSTTP